MQGDKMGEAKREGHILKSPGEEWAFGLGFILRQQRAISAVVQEACLSSIRGYLAMSGDVFISHDLGGIQWVEARAAARYPTMHRTAPSGE